MLGCWFATFQNPTIVTRSSIRSEVPCPTISYRQRVRSVRLTCYRTATWKEDAFFLRGVVALSFSSSRVERERPFDCVFNEARRMSV